MTGNRRKLPGAENTPLKGYAPLSAIVVVFMAVAVILPSEAPSTAAEGDAREVGVGETASGWGTTVSACADRQAAGRGRRLLAARATSSRATTAGPRPGASPRTRSRSAYRVTAEPNIISTFAAAAGPRLRRVQRGPGQHDRGPRRVLQRELPDVRPQAALRAGRGHRSAWFREIYGAGQAAANTDAIKTATEVEAFADVSALSQPYADALARQGSSTSVRRSCRASGSSSGAPTPGACSPTARSIGETGTEYAAQAAARPPGQLGRRLAPGQDAARSRSIAPDNPEYQQCVAASEAGHRGRRRARSTRSSTTTSTSARCRSRRRPCWPGCARPASPRWPARATR